MQLYAFFFYVVSNFINFMQEFADAMMEVKSAVLDVMQSKTLRKVVGTLLSIGNFLNGRPVSSLITNTDLNYLEICSCR